ncbi:MAG: diaminopimelate epimerase [Eubacteriales bacterium]|nr:diaminopimelate epimerase [Eubacteriales bacterium]
MKFVKMHGCGNDYVYVNCFEEKIDDPAALSIKVSDRHKGIGSDGLILVKPSDCADAEMDIYNADGSQAKMCGNGIRCVAKFVYDFGIAKKEQLKIDTQSGVKTLDLTIKNGKVSTVRVNMGGAELTAVKVPVIADTEQAIDAPILVDGKEYRYTAVSMGNPHAIVFMDDVTGLQIEEIGPKFENHPAFPDRVNTEFIKVLSEDTIQMRVWERGSGETMACGTGACAAAVASILNNKVKAGVPITVKLLGGDLTIEWDRERNIVYMTGPAETAFIGEY